MRVLVECPYCETRTNLRAIEVILAKPTIFKCPSCREGFSEETALFITVRKDA